jgi:flavin-dependent dehydrogenase
VADIDIVIVGAGPAGAVAALNLAPTRRVVLVERRADNCPQIGESLPPTARRLLLDMGLLEAFLAEGHLPCYGNRAVWGESAVRETDFLRDPDGNGWHLDRCRFDAWLRCVAVERGAALLRPAKLSAISRGVGRWRVSLTTAEGPVELTAAMVIECGGRAAPLARRLGAVRQALGDRLVCGWVQGEARTNAGDPGFSTIEAVEDGWWYTAPLPGQRRVLAYFTDADLPAARLVHNHGMLMASAMVTEEIGPLLGECAFVPVHGGIGAAHSSVLDRCTGPGWIAAGDASISFDPISSQGLLHALFTGLAAAEAADQYLTGQAGALDDYQGVIDRVKLAYLSHLTSCYASETRWQTAPLWRRRVELLSRGMSPGWTAS